MLSVEILPSELKSCVTVATLSEHTLGVKWSAWSKSQVVVGF